MPVQLDAAEADLAVARGRILHTRFLLHRDEDPAAAEPKLGELALFERAAQLYRELGDVRGESEALFWVGCSPRPAPPSPTIPPDNPSPPAPWQSTASVCLANAPV